MWNTQLGVTFGDVVACSSKTKLQSSTVILGLKICALIAHHPPPKKKLCRQGKQATV